MQRSVNFTCAASLLLAACSGSADPVADAGPQTSADAAIQDSGPTDLGFVDAGPQPCEAWLIEYALEPVGFEIRETPFGLGDQDNIVGPGRVRLRFEGTESGPVAGEVIMLELQYKLDFTISDVDTDLNAVAGPVDCGVAVGSRSGDSIVWGTPVKDVRTTGTLLCRASQFLCDAAGLPKDVPMARDRVADQPLQPFVFTDAEDFSGFVMAETEVPNEDPGATFLRFSGNELSRRCVPLPPDCP